MIRHNSLDYIKINSDADISIVITNGIFLATYNTDYPFYFLQSVKNPDYFITQISENEVKFKTGKNSKRQRFDVSHEELLLIISDDNRKDKTVKIQLKLDENSLQQILNELKADEPEQIMLITMELIRNLIVLLM